MCRSSGANPLALTARETSRCRWDSIFMTWICLGRLNLQFSRIRCVCNFCETKREKFGHFCTLWFKFLCSRSKILGSYFLTCPKHVWQRRFAAIKAERASTCSNPIKLNTFSQHLLLLHFVFAKKKLAGNPPLPTFSFRSVFFTAGKQFCISRLTPQRVRNQQKPVWFDKRFCKTSFRSCHEKEFWRRVRVWKLNRLP